MSDEKKEYTGELVKIFSGDSYQKEEAKVNAWLRENPEIDITQRLLTSSSATYPTIAIFYRNLRKGEGPFRE